MRKLIRPLIIVLLLLVLAGSGYWLYTQKPQLWQQRLIQLGVMEPPDEGLTASGYVEATQIILSPEVSGRITRLLVTEGDRVAAGQVLAEIESDLLDAERAEVEAMLAEATARLTLVDAGARPEDMAVLKASVALAEVQQAAAEQAWQDALTLRNNPQELDLQIEVARSQLAIADQRIQQMVPLKDAAELMNQLRERQVTIIEAGVDFNIEIPEDRRDMSIPDNVTLREDIEGAEPGDDIRAHYEFREGNKRAVWAAWNLASSDVWTAWTGVNGAVAAYEATQQNLDDLLALRDNPQQLQMRVAQAEAAYREATTVVEVAQANLDLIEAGATEQQIEVARANVAQAHAALDALEVQRQKYTLRAPSEGLILELPAHAGEVARPGAPVLTLGHLDSLELKVYIPEPDMGQVALGQQAEVTVDSYPGETFSGEVVWIAAEAEYTPSNVQTAEERATTVFAVKIEIANPEQKLKPGMPADVVLGDLVGTPTVRSSRYQ